MRRLLPLFIAITVLFIGCKDDELNIIIEKQKDFSFIGTFKTEDLHEEIVKNVDLKISDGYYVCTTSLPFGYGSGKLEISGNTITFIDTAFYPIPAIYGPSFVLSGEHHYRFDGDKLEIWKNKNLGSTGIIKYDLNLVR